MVMIHRFATYCLSSFAIAMTPPVARVPEANLAIPMKMRLVATPVKARIATQKTPGLANKPAKKPTPKPAKKPAKKAASLPILDKVQSFYERTDDLAADFIQTYTRVALSRTSESRGTVELKKPGMMRWDYDKPYKKHFIADGKTLWIFEPEEEQVIIDRTFKTSNLSSSVAFLWGRGRLDDTFVVKLAGTKGDTTILDMTPKTGATYSKMTLIVETKTGKVVESILHEASGNTNHFKFNNVRTNVGLDAKRFSFVPPANVEIVETP